LTAVALEKENILMQRKRTNKQTKIERKKHMPRSEPKTLAA
jgi:hypothetical protein